MTAALHNSGSVLLWIPGNVAEGGVTVLGATWSPNATGSPLTAVTVTGGQVFQDAGGLVPYPNNQITSGSQGAISFFAPFGDFVLAWAGSTAVVRVASTSLVCYGVTVFAALAAIPTMGSGYLPNGIVP
jgi:hypothetical protein